MPPDDNPFRAEAGEKPQVNKARSPLLQYFAIIAFSVIVPWVFLAILHYFRLPRPLAP